MTRYWPYEETTVTAHEPAGSYEIATPWLASRIEVEPGTQPDRALAFLAEHGAEALAEKAGDEIAAWVSETLQELRSLPIAYQLPRRPGEFGQDEAKPAQGLDLTSPKTLAASFGVSLAGEGGEEWSWDAEGMLAVAALDDAGERFDPVTLLTIARRFHYLDCLSSVPMDEVYASLAENDEATRKERLALMVRQNHYVTAECDASVRPALAIARSARPAVETFLQAERGHDQLLAKSLKEMGVDPAQVEPLASTRSLMTFLKAAASTNFLAFGLAVDFFEKPQFRDDDALGRALKENGEAAAARSLDIHKNINDQGGHDSVAQELIEFLRPVKADYAVQAIRLAELVSACVAAVPAELAAE